MKKHLFVICFLLSLCLPAFSQISGEKDSTLLDYDTTNPKKDIKLSHQNLAPYSKTVSKWTTIDDIHDWIKSHFEYDMERAKSLANNSAAKEKVAIYTPQEFWTVQKGICVDLSRFAFETAKSIDSNLHVNYLKIEFEPVEIDGKIFVNHWLVAYRENGKYYFLADSKRPEVKDGPYDTLEGFIKSYEIFRKRKISSYKLLSSYKKTRKKKSIKSVKR